MREARASVKGKLLLARLYFIAAAAVDGEEVERERTCVPRGNSSKARGRCDARPDVL